MEADSICDKLFMNNDGGLMGLPCFLGRRLIMGIDRCAGNHSGAMIIALESKSQPNAH